VRIPAADALAMEPLVLPEAIALLDRHYISLAPYAQTGPTFTRSAMGHLTLRNVDFQSNRLVLRPSTSPSGDLIDIDPASLQRPVGRPRRPHSQ